MYTVSESYKNALKEHVIKDSVSGTVTLTDGTVIELDDTTIVNGSLRITHELCGEYRIGTFNLGRMKIAFFDDNALLRDFSGAEIKITYKIETEEGLEEIPMGIFIADGQTVKRKRNTISLTAYDYGILFDCQLSDSVRAMTGTAENLIAAVCEKCGVSFGGIHSGMPNTAVVLNPTSAQIQSYRDLVEWCAAVLCGYAVIDREGQLKIISARYDVSTEDTSNIIIDKYLTSFERDSIYVTDTRAWIASISAYSGSQRKIYKSSITQPDEQAARAIYALEKNPLLADKTESECDDINSAWLSFIDGFKQRGITAQIYGDPALDVGDVLRCSEGDIDQRLSIVGLITKQEWCYRSFHSIVCAAAQLADGFPEGETESSGDADAPQPVKVIPQIEKKVDTVSEEGQYTAGEGLSLQGSTFILNPASAASLGGVYINEYADTGVTRETGTLGLKNATAEQLGGLKLGDGLVPVLALGVDGNGNPKYYPTQFIQLRLFDGLQFVDNADATDDLEEAAENQYGGRAVGLKLGAGLAINSDGALYVTGEGGSGSLTAGRGITLTDDGDGQTVAVNIGEGLEFDENGTIKATGGGSSYTSGNGIAIESGEESDVISVKIGEGLEIDESGAVSSMINADNSIIIQEADASYLLHSYELVDYVKGNKIVCIDVPQYLIVCNGCVCGRAYADAYTANMGTYANPVFALVKYGSVVYSNSGFRTEYARDYSTDDLLAVCYTPDGVEAGRYATAGTEKVGYKLYWTTVNPPTADYPYGYIGCLINFAVENADGTQSNVKAWTIEIGFASEAEYNASIGLTYVDETMTAVEETVTEVTE